MTDDRKAYTVTIHGLPHTLLLTPSDAAAQYGEAAVEVKAKAPENKARAPRNKAGK